MSRLDCPEAEFVCLYHSAVSEQDFSAELSRDLDQALQDWRQTIQPFKPKETLSLAQWFVAHEAREEIKQASELVQAWNRNEGDHHCPAKVALPDLDSDEFREPKLDCRDFEREQEVKSQNPPSDLSPSDAAKWKREYLKGVEREGESLPLPAQTLFPDSLCVTFDEIALSIETDGQLPLLAPVQADLRATGDPRLSKEFLKKNILDCLQEHAVPQNEIDECRDRSQIRLLRLLCLRQERFRKHDHSKELIGSIRKRPASPEQSQSAAIEAGNVFRLHGECWQIRFAGEEKTFTDALGFRYLHRLITHPGKLFTAIELAQAFSKACPPPAESIANEEDLHENAGTKQEIMPPEHIDQYRRVIQDRQLERETATFERRMEIDDEIEEVEKYLKKGSFQGVSRTFPDNAERARKSVAKAIGQAIDRVERSIPKAGQFLRAAVSRGSDLCFSSLDPWETQ